MQKFNCKKRNVVDVLKFYNAIDAGYLTYNMSAFPFPALEPEELLYIAIFFSVLPAKKVTLPSH